MKMFLIDVENCCGKVVEIEPTLEKYYELLNCDTIDIAERSVDGVYYDFICDDEGLFKTPAIPSALDTDHKPMLVGNLLICLHDGEGNEVGLEDKDIELIKQNIVSVVHINDDGTRKIREVIDNLDY